jgi:hypothetical protein
MRTGMMRSTIHARLVNFVTPKIIAKTEVIRAPTALIMSLSFQWVPFSLFHRFTSPI